MRYSLKDLMIFVAFCAAICWCAAQVGFDNGLFWFVVGVSAIMSALFVILARSERHRTRSLLTMFLVLPFFFLCFSMSLFTNAVLLAIAAFFFARRPPPSVRVLCGVSMVSALLMLAAGVVPGMIEFRKLEALRKEFPVVSLESRLHYETQKNASTGPRNAITNVSVVTQLNDFEQRLDNLSFWRRREFQGLHERQTEKFVRAVGFGIERMGYFPRVMPPGRPPLRDIRFDETSANTASSDPRGSHPPQTPGKSNPVEDLHLLSRSDFFDPEFFGFASDRSHVTGFVEHAFHYPPAASLEDPAAWTTDRLELVSLLKFAEPRVYVLDHLPRMDQLSSDTVPTRKLDAFETAALAKLWTAEDVVVSQEGHKVRMLGSLRAAHQCLDCHTADRGELLGAFSYSLHAGSSGK